MEPRAHMSLAPPPFHPDRTVALAPRSQLEARQSCPSAARDISPRRQLALGPRFLLATTSLSPLARVGALSIPHPGFCGSFLFFATGDPGGVKGAFFLRVLLQLQPDPCAYYPPPRRFHTFLWRAVERWKNPMLSSSSRNNCRGEPRTTSRGHLARASRPATAPLGCT